MKTDGQFYLGTIVDIDTDPRKSGRVKVMVPQLHSPSFNKDDMPWIQLASQSNHDGQISFDRPPQVGTSVVIWYPHGEKSSGYGVVMAVLNGVYSPQQIPGNTLLNDAPGWLRDALRTSYGTYRVPNREQYTEANDSGEDKVTTRITNGSDAPSITEKLEVLSSGAEAALMPLYDAVQNVATAKQASISAMTSSLASLLPGTTVDFTTLFQGIQLDSTMEGVLGLLGSNSPLSGANFIHRGIVADMEVLRSNIVERLVDIGDVSSFLDFLTEIKRNTGDILGSTANSLIESANNAFGSVVMDIDKNGRISITPSPEYTSAINRLSSTVESVENAVGILFRDSMLTTDMLSRLSETKQTAYKTFLEGFPSIAAKLEETR